MSAPRDIIEGKARNSQDDKSSVVLIRVEMKILFHSKHCST